MSRKLLLVLTALLIGWIAAVLMIRGARPDGVVARDEASRGSEAFEGEELESSPVRDRSSIQSGSATSVAPESSDPAPPRRIAGRLIDVDGMPVAASPVGFLPSGEIDLESVRQSLSDANGGFTIEVGDGKGVMFSRDPRFTTLFYVSPQILDSSVPPAVVVCPKRSIEGVVVGEDELPIEGVDVGIRVEAFFLETSPGVSLEFSTRRIWFTRTQEDGRFRFADAPAIEDATISARHERYESTQLWLTDQPEAIRIELRRKVRGPSYVEGTVVGPSGSPVPRADVYLGVKSRMTHDDGSFSLDVSLPDASGERQDVLAFKSGWLPVRTAVTSEELVITLRERTPPIRGRVLYEQGNPVHGALVRLLDPPTVDEIRAFAGLPALEDTEEGMSGVAPCEAATKEDGSFEIQGVLPRSYAVRVHDRRTLAVDQASGVEPGTEVELRLKASRLVPIRGRVVDPRGSPFEKAEVTLRRGHEGPDEILGAEMMTDTEGRFAGEVVECSDLFLVLSTRRASPPKSFPLVRQSGEEMILVVEREGCFRVEISTAGLKADMLRVMNDNGDLLVLDVRYGGGGRSGEEEYLDDEGRTGPLWVTEDARVLVLYWEEVEVTRLPIRIVPGEVTIVRP